MDSYQDSDAGEGKGPQYRNDGTRTGLHRRPNAAFAGKTALYMGGSVLLAFATAAFVFRFVSGMQEKVGATIDALQPIEVVVASQGLVKGMPITKKDVTVQEVLPTSVDIEKVFTERALVVGRVPRADILVGETVRSERLAESDAGMGLHAIITPGMRAMSIETDRQAAVGGFLQSDDFVDIIVTIRPDDGSVRAKWVTETILQGIRVLAIGSSLRDESTAMDEARETTGKRNRRTLVTLEVTPEQSEKLALGTSRGELHLVLRSEVDVTEVATGGPLVTTSLVGLTGPKKKRARTQKGPTTVVIEGSSTVVNRFNDKGTVVESSNSGRRR